MTIRSEIVSIRKPHKCFSCLRKFEIGTKMTYWVGTYDGDFCSSYSCGTCVLIFNKSDENEFPEGYVFEMLDRGQTTEQLLESINSQNRKHNT